MMRSWTNGARWIVGGIANPVERLGAALRRLATDDRGHTAPAATDRRHRGGADLERRRFELAVRNMPIGLCLFDPEKRLVICNQRYADMYGLPPELTKAGTCWRDIAQFWIDADSHTLGTGREFADRFDAVGDIRDTTIETIHLPGNRIYNIVHQPLDGGGWVATHEDVSDQRQAEREIVRLAGEAETERQRLETALANMPLGLAMFDADKRLITANQSFARLYGLPENLVRRGTVFRDILDYRVGAGEYPGGDPEVWIDRLMKIGDSGEPTRDIATFEDGRTVRIVHQPTAEGGWVSVHEDVTERYTTQREIARLGEEAEIERQRLRAALTNMPIGLTMFDADKRLITANQRYADLYGIPDHMLQPGTPFTDFLNFRIREGSYPEGSAEDWQTRLLDIMDRGEATRDMAALTGGRMVSIVREPMAGGGWVATHQDVTEQYRAEQEVARLAEQAEVERQRLDATMNNMPIGVCMFDGNRRLISANSRYAEMYGVPDNLLTPGTSVEQIVDHRIQTGTYSDPDSRKWLDNILTLVERGEEWRDLRHAGDGRIFGIIFKPLKEGGWVSTHEDVTERHTAQVEIERLGTEAEIERQRLDAALTNMPIGLTMFDADKRLITANQRYAEIYEIPPETLKPGTPFRDFMDMRIRFGNFPAEGAEEWLEELYGMVDRGEATRNVTELQDGRVVSIVHEPMVGGGWIATHEDITERHLAEREIARLADEAEVERHRLNAAISNMPIGLVMFDADKRLIVANARYVEMYRMPTHLAVPGTSLDEILEQRAKAGEYGGPNHETYDRQIHEMVDRGRTASTILHFRDGRIFSVIVQPMQNGGWVATHEDVTDRQKAQAQIAHMAHHDHLTDLPNRVLFLENLEDALAREETADGVAVLYLDIDHFNAVNDALGHPVGDKLLQAVAQRLSRLIRHGDTVARLSGDEFAIVQNSTEQPKSARALAQRVIEDLGAPYTIDGHPVTAGVSIGIALAPTDGRDATHLLKNGGMALYRAKADGRGRYRFFEPGMDARMQERRKLELDLRKAVQEQEFELHYQPQIDLKTGNISGFEALLRWHHPERGMIPPMDFIPAAEETGLIVPIGEWVLKEACTTASAWPSDIKVAVNLSPVQFRSTHLLQSVVSALTVSGLAASRLELEVTESVLLADTDAILALLGQLHALGVHVAMDDFGTGYSSLGYLQKFRFDKIKIDRSFVQRLCDDDNSMAIVRAIVGISNSMGIATTAEGVETQDQLDRVRAEGCTDVQGYFTGRPMTADMAARLLRDGPASARAAVA